MNYPEALVIDVDVDTEPSIEGENPPKFISLDDATDLRVPPPD